MTRETDEDGQKKQRDGESKWTTLDLKLIMDEGSLYGHPRWFAKLGGQRGMGGREKPISRNKAPQSLISGEDQEERPRGSEQKSIYHDEGGKNSWKRGKIP